MRVGHIKDQVSPLTGKSNVLTTQTENRMKVIVGLGKTGLSCARFLASRGEHFKVVDSRQNPPGLQQLKAEHPGVELELGDFNQETFMNADKLIVSPGVDQQTPAIKKAAESGVQITGDVNIFAREISAPIVAVTGSNAKSTVTTLVGEMAIADGINVAVAGNIGLPVLDCLLQGRASLYVLELSSFQLETTSDLGAEVATVLNISPDHMDRYATLEEYARAKYRIYEGCRQAVINDDDRLSAPELPTGIRQWHFGLSKGYGDGFFVEQVNGEECLCHDGEVLMPASELRMPGRHNIANALAALALGNAVGLSVDAMVETLKCFPGLEHRCQWVAESAGVNWYNDSKGTNVGACIAAVEGFGNESRLILIAGGQGKEADFNPLEAPLSRHCKLVILFGEDAALLEKAVGQSVATVFAGSLEEAVRLACKNAVAGDTVLFSPACASFDMFRNYEERGDVFMRCVRELH